MCPHEDKLTAWLLGDLPPDEQQALARHLDACASCRGVRDELARVLAPLRSGLEKDGCLQMRPPQARREARRTPYRLFFTRHEGLRRAALFAVSFGSLFALVSVVYRQTARPRHSAEAITHITFQRQEAPVPPLAPAPVAQAKKAAASDLADFKTGAVSPEPAAPEVLAPALPAPEPNMPDLSRLVKTRVKGEAAEAPAPSPSARPWPSQAKAVAKRDRDKAETPAPARPPAGLHAKPFPLAAGALPAGAAAPTNAAPTNAIPTNAAAPSARRTQP